MALLTSIWLWTQCLVPPCADITSNPIFQMKDTEPQGCTTSSWWKWCLDSVKSGLKSASSYPDSLNWGTPKNKTHLLHPVLGLLLCPLAYNPTFWPSYTWIRPEVKFSAIVSFMMQHGASNVKTRMKEHRVIKEMILWKRCVFISVNQMVHDVTKETSKERRKQSRRWGRVFGKLRVGILVGLLYFF